VNRKNEEEKDKTYEPGDDVDEESDDDEEEDEEEEEEDDEEEECDKIESDDEEDEELSQPINIDNANQLLKPLKKTSKKEVLKPAPKPLKITIKKTAAKKPKKILQNDTSKEKKQGKNKKRKAAEKEDAVEEKKRILEDYNDTDVSVNLHFDALSKIVETKIKLTANMMVMCHVLDASQTPLNNDFPAITFSKKMKEDNKAYNFSIPMTLLPKIENAFKIIRERNPDFYNYQRNVQFD
jgi:hypothetical protein